MLYQKSNCYLKCDRSKAYQLKGLDDMAVTLCDLGEIGMARLQSCLTCGRLLSRHVLARMNLGVGAVLAAGWGRIELAEPAVLDQAPVGSSGPSIEESAATLLQVLHQIGGDFESAAILVENDLAKPDDPAIVSRPTGSVVIAEDIVYHLGRISEFDSPDSLVEYLGSSSSGYPLNSFVLKSLTREQIVSAFAQRRLSTIVSDIEAIINSIFDNGGYSIWLPDRVLASLSL